MCLPLNKQKNFKNKMFNQKKKSNFKKGDCHLHSTLKQKLNAIFILRTQHNIKLLCKIFNINRSTYSKYISNNILPRIEENQMISKVILKIYGDFDERLNTYKITHIFEHDYGIKTSFERVYRLIQKLNSPTTSTSKPVIPIKSFPTAENHINYLTSNHHKNTHNKE